jgi:hypothetical protein
MPCNLKGTPPRFLGIAVLLLHECRLRGPDSIVREHFLQVSNIDYLGVSPPTLFLALLAGLAGHFEAILPMVKNICLLNLVNAYDALWLASL